VEEFGEHGEYRITRSTQDMDDEITDNETTRLIFISEELGDQLQDMAEAGLSRGITPR
jgi:hypothetical protein